MEWIENHPDFSQGVVLPSAFQRVADALGFNEGKCYKQNRYRTVRRFESRGQGYFVKQFFRVPWSKQFACLFAGAKSESQLEWQNIQTVRELDIPTLEPVKRGERRVLGFEAGGFCITRELPARSRLEDFLKSDFLKWPRVKRNELIDTLALYVRRLHEANWFHKDLYLGHFLIQPQDEGFTVYLIDLQRLARHSFRRGHFTVKDLAALHFSLPVGTLRRTEQLRFYKNYLGRNRLRAMDKKILERVLMKSGRIARHTVKLLARRKQ